MQTVLKPKQHDVTDTFTVKGCIRIRKLPAMSKAEWERWWPHLTERERDHYTDAESHNIITTVGRTQILTFVGNPTSNSTSAFAQYFAVGTFPTSSVNPGDTSIGTEIFRAVPSTHVVTGNTVDISTFFGTSQGNGTLTSCGLFGISATATLNSGSLMTHALLNSYVKTSSNTVTFDYLITLN